MLRGFFITIGMVTLLSLAHGADESNKPEAAGDCRAEFHKVCGQVEKGEGRLQECISKNMASFSPQCAERAKKRQENHAKMKACHEEMKKLCGSVEKGEGRKKKCIEENKSKLSPDCQALGERMKERREKRQAAPKAKAPETK